jgi:vancomycin resistance protein YoaR
MLALKGSAARTAWAIAIAVGAGLGVGLLLVPTTPGPGDDRTPLPETTFLGQRLPATDAAQKLALERARLFLAGKFHLDLPDGARRELYLGQLGAELDRVHLASLVKDARDRTSALLRVHRGQAEQKSLRLPAPIALDRARAFATLILLKDELDRVPVDARLDLEKRELVAERYGRLLDVDASLQSIERALRGGERSAKLVFHERKPKRIAKELGNVEFGHTLGFFETRYDRSERQEARTYNLRLAASKLDGTVLLPGEIFDFNGVVGPRDEANGYKVASVIAQGELVDGIGGGTCQISGTLHGAAFFAGLEITERYPHTRPSAYIKLGLDATVVYPTINFRIRNPFSFPVVLHQTVKNGIVRAEVLGPTRTLTVTLVRRVLDFMPYEEVERPDKELPRGVRVLSQRGVPGFKLRRYRIVREGAHASRQRWDDVYPPTSQIIRVGAGEVPRDSAKIEDDKHPEYLADELLVMTQGADPDNETDALQWETREPGKTGVAGWTEAAGMPFFDGGTGEPADNDSKTKDKSTKKS